MLQATTKSNVQYVVAMQGLWSVIVASTRDGIALAVEENGDY
jgi:hypothetical protein